MDMSIDEPRKQSTIPQIDHLDVGRMFYRRTGLNDAFSFHQNLAGRDYAPIFDVQQPRRMQQDRMRCRSALGCDPHEGNSKQEELNDSCKNEGRSRSHIARDGNTMNARKSHSLRLAICWLRFVMIFALAVKSLPPTL